jgi:hypothetical protein
MMLSRIHAAILCVVCSCLVMQASAETASDAPRDRLAVVVGQVRYVKGQQGIVVELNGQTPYQLIQVDEREILLVLKNGQDMSLEFQAQGSDPLIQAVSTGRFPGNVLGLVIHTKSPVHHEAARWMENGRHLLIQLKS